MVKVGGVGPTTEGIIMKEVLDPFVQEDILHTLRAKKVFDKAPCFRNVEIFLVHGNEGVQCAVAFAVHAEIDVSSVLVGPVMVDCPTDRKGEIAKEDIGGVGILPANRVKRIKQGANHFRGAVGTVSIPQIITLELVGKGNTINESAMVRLANGCGEGSSGISKEKG
jgi:hypothetical protein